MAWGFYRDSNLTDEVTSGSPLRDRVDLDAIADQTFDHHVWFGNPSGTGTKKVIDQAAGEPTTIKVSVIDATPGNNNPSTRMFLASTQGGLAGATGGALYDTTVAHVIDGVSNAISFWIRYKILVSAPEIGGSEVTYTDLSFQTQILDSAAV